MKHYNYKKRALIHGLSMAVFMGACLGLQADDQKGISASTSVNASDASSSDRSDNDHTAVNGVRGDSPRVDYNSNSKLSHADASFIKEAADGGLMEVKMGQMAKDHAQNADVKNFGERLVKDHTKANDKLSQLAASKGVNLAKEGEPHKTGMLKDWENKNGADFDKAFIQHEVKDHKKDIEKFEKASRDSKDSDLKSFAMETLPTLREHYDEAVRIARSLGLDITTADNGSYQRDATLGSSVSASPAAGSPGVSVHNDVGENRLDGTSIQNNSSGRFDSDVDRTRTPGASVDINTDHSKSSGASVDVNANTSKTGDNQSSSYYNNSSSAPSGSASVSTSGATSSSDTGYTASTASGDHKVLGLKMEKGDGKTLGLNTRKDDGKYLGFIPTIGHKKAENRVDVDANSSGVSASTAVGSSSSAQTGADADVSVKKDKDSKANTVSFSELPQAVQDTIKSHGGSSDVKNVRKHTEEGKTVYSVSIRKEGKDEKLKISEDGTVLKDNNK